MSLSNRLNTEGASMNIRFSDRRIRFRVMRHELDNLLGGRSLALDVPMPRAHRFRASINVTALGDWQLDSDPTGIWLSIPRAMLEELLQDLPSKEGLNHEFDTESGKLTVAFEVDLRKDFKAAA
jgi:hypothetical protein